MPLAGEPKDTPIPPHLRRWNWGAFFLNWIWGVGNSTYIALLMFVPFVNIVMIFVLGARGSEWAWKNRIWDDEAHFKRVQRNWARAGLIVLTAFVLLIVWLLSLFKSNQAYIDSMALLRENREAIEVLGKPIKDGWMPQGQISISGGSGTAAFLISVSGPKCSGKLISRAEKVASEWHIYLLVLQPECQDAPIVLINERDFNIPNTGPAPIEL